MSLKTAKVRFLVDIATDLFLCRSIQEVTIRDIAISAQVGEATIYRYFGKKQQIVVEAAMKLQSIVTTEFFDMSNKNTGFQQLEAFYMSYLDIFKKRPEFYKFLNEFDGYMAGENSDILNPYESAIDGFKTVFMNAYQLGIKDGSIKKQENIDMFYFSTTHALLELCKKLSAKAVLSQDTVIEKEKEISYLIGLILKSLNSLRV